MRPDLFLGSISPFSLVFTSHSEIISRILSSPHLFFEIPNAAQSSHSMLRGLVLRLTLVAEYPYSGRGAYIVFLLV